MRREEAWVDFLEAKGLRKRGGAAESAVVSELQKRGAPADVAQQAAKRGLDSRYREDKGGAATAPKGLDRSITIRELLYNAGVDLKGVE